MALLRHGRSGSWHEPESVAYTNEAALQQLLAESPGLLHGISPDQSMVAAELFISGTGYLDLAVVELDGSLTLVECKLHSNSEIRREIVGQILAYASALTAWSAQELEESWLTTTGRDLVVDAAALATVREIEFDTKAFRQVIDRNLAEGRFRLILAVDQVTPELRRIVEFLNLRSADDLEVLCIEFGYISDGDVEILIPNTYGVEAVERKARKIARHTESDFRTALTARCPAPVAAGVEELLDHATAHDAFGHVYWGTGAEPSVTPQFHTAFGDVQPWTFYMASGGKDVLAVNYDWIFKRGKGFPDPVVARFRDALAALSSVATRSADAQQVSWGRRPSIPAEPLFTDGSAVPILTRALDELLDVLPDAMSQQG